MSQVLARPQFLPTRCQSMRCGGGKFMLSRNTHTHTHARTPNAFLSPFSSFTFFLLLFLLLLYSLHPREGEIGHDGRDGCVSAGCLSIGITYDCRRTGKGTSVDDSVKGSRGWGGKKLEYRKG